ncbi:hypothetical protein DKG71_27450 [Streptomyces sp. NEAU-S7GS2]|nr:hypothetical protein DKG71_27450 [Streptomyces sp. NEAU-S7GS2]
MPGSEEPSVQVATTERSVILLVSIMLITGLASSRRLGGSGIPFQGVQVQHGSIGSRKVPLSPLLPKAMGMRSARANYFFDEFFAAPPGPSSKTPASSSPAQIASTSLP